MTLAIPMIGKRFGSRFVLGEAEPRKWNPTKKFWIVKCDCGSEDVVLGQALRDGKAQQCRNCRALGFVVRHTTHGQSVGRGTPAYRSWESMRARCLCKTHHEYAKYGGRGILICSRWQGEHGFENFLQDMGERPEGKTLDRYPNPAGNYEPGNCRWATSKEQIQNQRKHGCIDVFTDNELIEEMHRRGFNVQFQHIAESCTARRAAH